MIEIIYFTKQRKEENNMETVIVSATGEIVKGELRGDIFVHEKDVYTGDADVYVLDEITLNKRPVFDGVLAALPVSDYPTELDNDFSDADMSARENIANEIAAAKEAAEFQKLINEFLVVGAAYLKAVDNAMAAVEHAAFDHWEEKESA